MENVEKLTENSIRKRIKEKYRTELSNVQMKVKDSNLPVIIMLEGYGAAGKGSVISSIIKYMDPRFFKVYNMDVKSDDEKRKPFLYRYASKMPAKGQISIYDGGYMDECVKELLNEDINIDQYISKIRSIRNYERQLRDNGYLVIKFFLSIDKDTQKKRLEKLKDSKNTKWRVSKEDTWQNKNHSKFKDNYNEFISQTDTKEAPWHVIDANNKNTVEQFIAETIVSEIEKAIKNPWENDSIKNPYKLIKTKELKKIKLNDKLLTSEEYKDKLDKLQNELGKLQNKLYRKKIPVIIAYEGWDAAGKGGNIKRVASSLDPRGYEVFPIASPSKEEKDRHFLWRFYNRLPKTGHIAIFDRTWYGRVMVERLEGFCSENDWKRAYNEINEFEKDLTDWGAIVIKFWVHIDKDTQLERFTLRQNTPEKQWKITDEDWRNREKWDQYEDAINEMIAKTSTDFAPWHILESNDKKYARIKALETIIDEIKKRI